MVLMLLVCYVVVVGVGAVVVDVGVVVVGVASIGGSMLLVRQITTTEFSSE